MKISTKMYKILNNIQASSKAENKYNIFMDSF